MVFYPLYFFYIAIIIYLFYDLIEVRVISRIRAFGTSIAGLTIIVARNRNSRRGGSLLFCNLLGI
jgi:surface polysaccharide O-acyltransferase-like enzyme